MYCKILFDIIILWYGDDMKKLVIMGLLLITFGVCMLYNSEIVAFTVSKFINPKEKESALVNNDYALNNSYNFVQITDNFSPSNRQDILNIYYTVINSGMENFTFYCPKEYKNCISEVDNISNDQTLLSNINNFVPVYNSFQTIETEFDTLGKVDIKITHSYNDEQIKELDNKIKTVIAENITDNMDTETKIKTIHDYIINTTKYDRNRSDNKIKQYHSDTAYGALIEHYAICGGYSDSMKLFLDKLNIPNYKISSENHIWNLVKVNDKWYHLDLTWDDPIKCDQNTNQCEDIIEYVYFLISTEELQKVEADQHIFDKNIYTEAN